MRGLAALIAGVGALAERGAELRFCLGGARVTVFPFGVLASSRNVDSVGVRENGEDVVHWKGGDGVVCAGE